MPTGNTPQDPINNPNYQFIDNTTNLNGQELNIKVELGKLYIQPRGTFAASFTAENFYNIYYPSPGGEQGQSFVNNNWQRNLKSNTLKTVTHGIMPTHIDISGAPYSTFIEGTLLPNTVHPLYDLIQGPSDAPTYTQSGTLDFVSAQPIIQDQFFNSNSNASPTFNKVGSVFIPGTTKTSNAVKNVLTTPLTSYNIWTIDNLGGITTTNKLQYFDFIGNLGFVPKSGTTSAYLQPYAQTWSFTDTAQIQVFSSNAQVSLTRKYPMTQDYAHQSGSKYLIYNSATTSSPTLQANPVGLNYSSVPVGFCIKFSSLVVNNTIPVQANNNSAVLTEPKLIISWGDINATTEQLDAYTSQNRIGKYVLEFNINKPPRLFFNVNVDIQNENIINGPNYNSVELNNLKQIFSSDRNSGAKTDNDYELYVYYTGPYLKIGNSKSPDTWQVVRNQVLQPSNTTQYVTPITLNHWLDKNSTINIQAQYMNFVFSYGPPLFSPHDDQNIPAITNDSLANTLNQISQTHYTNSGDSSNPQLSAETIQSEFENYISQSKRTFDLYNNNEYTGGSSAYIDTRSGVGQAGAPNFSINVTDGGNGVFYTKMTMPQDLGGHVFNKLIPTNIPDPSINDSYVQYNLVTSNGNSDYISQILSQNIVKLSIDKKVNDDTLAYLTSTLDIDFVNLNNFDDGMKILQFMRHNVCAIRISAGYNGNLYPYFEGVISEIVSKQSLSETLINVKANDLMNHLFIDSKTMIVSKQNMQFPGMTFLNTIRSLVYHTELNNHFQFDLGDPTDTTTIAYNLYTGRPGQINSFPKISDTQTNHLLATPKVGPYDTGQNTYFSVLKLISTLLLQVPTDSYYAPFDIPILYWYTYGANGEYNINLDVIIMSSRNLSKDQDDFYIRRGDIPTIFTQDITQIHGYLKGIDGAFMSSSNSDNLMLWGLYRFIDIDANYQQVVFPNPIPVVESGPLDIDTSEGYIGYERIVNFDKGGDNLTYETTISGITLPDYNYANDFLTRWFTAAYSTVYEQISLEVYVTRPLKEYGYFTIFVESDENSKIKNQIPEHYLYSSVNYNFDIVNNLISAKVDASKKPIAGL
jgi:hypothetical protein